MRSVLETAAGQGFVVANRSRIVTVAVASMATLAAAPSLRAQLGLTMEGRSIQVSVVDPTGGTESGRDELYSVHLHASGSGGFGSNPSIVDRAWRLLGREWRSIELEVSSRQSDTLVVAGEFCRGPRGGYLIFAGPTLISNAVPISLVCSGAAPAQAVVEPVDPVGGELTGETGLLAGSEDATAEASACSSSGWRWLMPAEFRRSEDRWLWESSLPRACKGLELRVPGAAVLAWTLSGDSGQGRHVAERPLTPAAWLGGQLVDEATGSPVAGVAVVVVPAHRLWGVLEDLLQDTRTAFPPGVVAVESDSSGYWELANLGRGRYVAVAYPRAASGLAVAVGPELHVEQELVYEYPQLTLGPGGGVSVRVDLAGILDDLPPQLQGLKLVVAGQLKRPDCGWYELSSRELTVGQRDLVEASFDGLMPGRWRFSASLARDGAMSVVGEGEVFVTRGEPSVLWLEPTGHWFRGRVTTSDQEPLGGGEVRILTTSSTVSAEISDQGWFAAFLTTSGRYDVEIRPRTRGALAAAGLARSWVRGVPFDDPSVPVEIELPGGRIGGWVVCGECEEPLRHAIVQAGELLPEKSAGRGFLQTFSEVSAEGRFLLTGVPPGSWTLTALSGKRRSPPVTVGLSEGESVDDVVLRVGPMISITGRVESGGEGVGGAYISSFVLDGSAFESAVSPSAVSDEEGWFQLDLPEVMRSRPLQILAQHPDLGQGSSVWRDGSAVRIELPEQLSRVTIRSPDPDWRPSDLAFVRGDGVFFFLDALSYGVVVSSDGIAVTGLEPGTWRLVKRETLLGREGRDLLLNGRGAELNAIASFALGAGDQLEVRLPSVDWR